MTNSGETIVQVGVTDGWRYIGVTPPLTEEEVRTMEWAGVLPVGIHRTDIDEFNPPSTLLTVAGEMDGPPEAKTEKAQKIAGRIAYALRVAREGHVEHRQEPVWLNGHNSTPFYPDTDALRRS